VLNPVRPGDDARLTVAVAEAHPVEREALVRLLRDDGGFAVMGQAGSVEEARVLVASQSPQVLVMDLLAEDLAGLDLIRDLAARAPALRIVVFSLRPEEVYAERCLRAGAHGYVMKRAAADELFAAVRAAGAGGVTVSPRIAAALLASLAGPARAPANARALLTGREQQIYRMVGQGLASKAIAARLGVSLKTIESHREHIKLKLGLGSGAALVTAAVKWVRTNEAGAEATSEDLRPEGI